ncbi:L-histidine N(alpha)-methyltransferase [Candidatus Peregrinibacteria bacterium]|nr:L-histidine N(alpha)-methyltransferase [Candidatus Peregrinibacteria bacterium]
MSIKDTSTLNQSSQQISFEPPEIYSRDSVNVDEDSLYENQASEVAEREAEELFANITPANEAPPRDRLDFTCRVVGEDNAKMFSEKALALKVLKFWELQDNDANYRDNPHQLQQALRYSIEIKKYVNVRETKTIQDDTRDLATEIISDSPTEDFYKPWRALMKRCLQENRLCPAIKYLDADKWYDVCQTPEYSDYYMRATDLLKVATPKVLEVIMDDRIQDLTYLDLGIGNGEKAMVLLQEILIKAKGLKQNINIRFEVLDASMNILEQALICIFKYLYANKPAFAKSLSGLNAFCSNIKHNFSTRFNKESYVKWTDLPFLFKLRKIIRKFLQQDTDFTSANKLLNHLLAAKLGIHTTDKDLLQELTLNSAYANRLDIVPRLLLFSHLLTPAHKPKKATATSKTLITAFGNTPIGNNSIRETMELFDGVLDEPELEHPDAVQEQDIQSNYLLMGVHLRNYTPEDEEFENEKKRILTGYETPKFKNFVQHAFSIPQLKLKMHIVNNNGGRTEIKDINDAADLIVTYDNKPWRNNKPEEKNEETTHHHYYRVTHILKFKCDTEITINGSSPVYKKAGEEMLMHYSYKFTLEELETLLGDNGFKIVKQFTDKPPRNPKFKPTLVKMLIRKMTQKEQEDYKKTRGSEAVDANVLNEEHMPLSSPSQDNS